VSLKIGGRLNPEARLYEVGNDLFADRDFTQMPAALPARNLDANEVKRYGNIGVSMMID
jgi:hypothetical protein